MGYWLFKSEPQAFSLQDLRAKKRVVWDGVRNYTARNFLRDQVKLGDGVFFYHSSCPEPGIAGQAKVLKEGFPDPTAFDPKEHYYDPKSDPAQPRWYSVEVAFVAQAAHLLPLGWLREHEPDMPIFKYNRLSIVPIEPDTWVRLCKVIGFDPKMKDIKA